jgi:hypothetical protein
VVVDPDMLAPRPFTILRSTGSYVAGGFQSTVAALPVFGPVQQASNKEVQMLPEADRISSVRSFWSTRPIYATQGYAPVPGVHGEAPQGSGTAYTLSAPPPGGAVALYVNGLLLQPDGVDYSLNGASITFNQAPFGPPYATWQQTVNAAANASDILQYGDEQYRVLQVYRDDGGGYWKALATRMAAA